MSLLKTTKRTKRVPRAEVEGDSVWWHAPTGHYTALIVGRGRKFMSVITMPQDGRGVRIRKLNLTVAKYFKALTLNGQPYPLERHKQALLRAGETFGITEGARKALDARSYP